MAAIDRSPGERAAHAVPPVLLAALLAGCGGDEAPQPRDSGVATSTAAEAPGVADDDRGQEPLDSLLEKGVRFSVAPVELPVPLAFWGAEPRSELEAYPRPVPVAAVARAAALPRLQAEAAFTGPHQGANNAVRVTVEQVARQPALFGRVAPDGWSFVVVSTDWENIHPRQRVRKDRRPDRTMGLGNFANATQPQTSAETVEADVEYQVPGFLGHAYLVAGGRVRALHEATVGFEDGAPLRDAFSLAHLGDHRPARFAYLVPDDARDLVFRFLDYGYGHIALPVLGSVEAANRTPDGARPLSRASHAVLDLEVDGFDILTMPDADRTDGPPLEGGTRTARLTLAGLSRSEQAEGKGDIVQLPLYQSVWLELDGGYLVPPVSATSDPLRFTPELFQEQIIDFVVPEEPGAIRLGIRIDNDVIHMDLGRGRPSGLPGARSTHRDGDVLEVRYLGQRVEGDHLVVDLAVLPLGDAAGVEIRTAEQFRMVAGSEEHRIDRELTRSLPRGRASNFVLPPGTAARFELAYRLPPGAAPTAIRYRGFASEGELAF